MAAYDPEHDHLLLFDGVCNLCSASVRFLIERDRASVLRFAAIQSAVTNAAIDAVVELTLPLVDRLPVAILAIVPLKTDLRAQAIETHVEIAALRVG